LTLVDFGSHQSIQIIPKPNYSTIVGFCMIVAIKMILIELMNKIALHAFLDQDCTTYGKLSFINIFTILLALK
jgi:hypothetical protein